MDTLLKLASEYGIPSVTAIVLIVLGNVVAAWLTQTFFPMRLKKNAWKWEKEKWATEKVFEPLSLIEFLGNCLQSELEDRSSMSALGTKDTANKIYKTVLSLHQDSPRLRPYLSRSNKTALDGFLRESHIATDNHKEEYSLWGPGHENEDRHSQEEESNINFVHAQQLTAKKYLQKIEFI